jgi:hypothetical protein
MPVALRPWALRQPPPDPQHGLYNLLAPFEPITLAQMDATALLDRSEVKYVLPQNLLTSLLPELRGAYRVLVVAEQPCSRYRTLYFDTADLELYRRHHAGAQERYKVRTREYVDSRVAFLEVKHKIGSSHTVKNRIPIDDMLTDLTAQAAAFVDDICPYPAEALHARLWNHYTRITLVNKCRLERVTLDLGLAFTWGETRVALPGIVVAEVKYQGHRQASEFVRLMRAHHVRDTSFSKYCMGVSWLYPDVKHNQFKAKQRLVARLAQGVSHELS